MGFNLADFGLVSSGWNASADAERARQIAEEDRLAQLELRRQKQAQAAAAQAEFERQQAFQTEARQIVPKFLSGGDQAIPAQPASTTEIPQPAISDEGEGNTTLPPAVKENPAKPASDNYAGMYDALQKVALKHGRVADYETMKGHAQKLQEEGVLDFVRAARRGADDEELKDTFNKSGKVRLKQLTKVGADQYAGLTEDGKPVAFDLNQITESLLAPKDLLAHKDRGELQQVRRELGQAATEARNTATQARLEAAIAKIDAADGVNAARAALMSAQAELARVKAGGGGGKGRTAGNWNQFDKEVRTLAQTHLTTLDADTGKPTLDRKNMVALTSMAAALARDDPESYGSPAEAVAGAVDKMAEIKRVQEDAQTQAADEVKDLGFTDPKQRERWTRSRADNLARARQSAAAPAPAKAASVPAAAGVEEPQTEADFAKLKKGARYKNPADGKVYVKN